MRNAAWPAYLVALAATLFAIFPLTDTDIWWHMACAREWVTTWTPVRIPVVNVHDFFSRWWLLFILLVEPLCWLHSRLFYGGVSLPFFCERPFLRRLGRHAHGPLWRCRSFYFSFSVFSSKFDQLYFPFCFWAFTGMYCHGSFAVGMTACR